MKIILETPTKLRIDTVTEEELIGLQTLLTYKSGAIENKIRMTKKNYYLVQRFGQEHVDNLISELNKELYKSLLFSDSDGLYTLPGLKEQIERRFAGTEFVNMVHYPDFQLIPWQKAPPYTPKDFQELTIEAFLNNPHSHAEIATGLGKTLIAILLAKHTGLPTVISTPSVGLAKALYRELTEYFGKRRVGMFGAGKKEIGKDILVCVGKSLSMVKEPDMIAKFKKYQVFISDESHTLPAAQFDYFCHNVLGHIPYRWFLSATQERNDGKDLLLEGIIGKNVFTRTIQEGIAKGDLAALSTLVFDVPSASYYQNSQNSVKMNQKHFYQNETILNLISTIVPDALAKGIPTIILIDEHEQELLLRNRLGNVYEYARGGSDTEKICRDFNEGKVTCVVGTSAVSTGTNFKPVRLTINWQAGKAETKFKQGVIGRSTRIDIATGKTSCNIIDFRIKNIPMLTRHANFRIRLYKQVGPVQIVEYKS